ncbi:MAG: arsenate reductase ArsC [Bacteroidales bacterium]|nr:arsenate reductase ArsC [Bacteroidales bacterium]
MKKILVLCTGNSCRSQMAEGWLRYYGKGACEVYSAGIEAHGLNPYAKKVMMDAVIDITNHTSDTVDKYQDIEFDYVITVCDNAKENCPVLPGNGKMIHQSFPDPAKFEGTEEEKIVAFSKVRDLIEDFCFDFIDKNIKKLS